MADTSFAIEILANLEKATASVQGFAKNVDKEVSKIGKSFSGITSVATGALAALGVGFSLKHIIDEAVASEEAVNRFNLVLQQTNSYTEDGAKAFEEYALSIQRSTGIADEAILSLASTIQRSSGLSQKDLAAITQATVDFAKFADIDLSTAGEAVSKALNGTEGALSRYRINVKAGKNDTEQFSNVLSALGVAQGFAEKRAQTFGGQVAILKGEFSQLLETIGGAIINNKALVDTLSLVKDVIVRLTNSLADSSSEVSAFASGAAFLARIVLATGDLLYRGFVTVIDLAIVSLAGIAKYLGIATQYAIKFFKTFGIGVDILDDAEVALDKFSTTAAGIADAGADSIKNTFTRPILGFQDEIVNTDKKMKTLIDTFSGKSGSTGAISKAVQEAQKAKEKADAAEQDQRDKIIKAQIKADEDFKKSVLTAASSFVGSVQQGAAGAAGALAGAAGLIADTLLPGIGGVVTSLFNFLAQGPEAVKAQIQAFIDQIPVVIQAVVDSIPVVIDTLVANLPTLIERLAAVLPSIFIQAGIGLSLQMPFIALTLATSLIAQAPNIALSFINALIAQSGLLIQSLADGIKNAISQTTGGASGGPVGIVKSVTKKLKFAEGGVVPGGFPADSFNASLTSGEGVIPLDTMRRLDQYLSGAVSGGQSSGGGGGTTIVKLIVGEQELANVMLSLNQRGFRLG